MRSTRGSDTKTCSQCDEEKSLDDFYLDNERPRANCKDCHKRAIYARRNADPERFRAYQAAWREQNREKIRTYARDQRNQHGGRWNALRREARAENPERFRKTKREWWARNRERISEHRRARWTEIREDELAKRRKDRKRNPGKYRAWGQATRERHRDRINAYQREYYIRNPEVFERGRAKRRALLAGVEYEPYTRREIYDRDGGRCRGCEKELLFGPNGFQIDHIVPISLGGPDTPTNVQLMCPACNREKWAKLEGQIHLPV